MLDQQQLQKRQSVWVALPELWLDTELTEQDMEHIAQVMAEAGFSIIGFEPWRSLEDARIQPNSEHAMETISDTLTKVYREWRDGGRFDTAPSFARSLA